MKASDSTGSADLQARIAEAASIILKSSHLTAFTGAGISVESGIPPFRGENGLWSKYNPQILEINYFLRHPEESWKVIRKIFYDHFERAEPNPAHRILAKWEHSGLLKATITQNIDNLHFRAGSRNVIEYHGNSRELTCLECGKIFNVEEEEPGTIFKTMPPRCSCGGILKPRFVFFGEGIPPEAAVGAERESKKSDVMLVIGSTGEVYPASLIPAMAKESGASIVEINTEASNYTNSVTDIFIRARATKAMLALDGMIAHEMKPGNKESE